MQLWAGGVLFDVDLIVLDKDGTMFDLDETWARLAVEWEDTIESRLRMPGIAALLAEHTGHDRAGGEVRHGSVLAAGTMQQLREAMKDVIVAAGGEPGVVDEVVLPGENNLTPKGDLAGWVQRMHEAGFRIVVLTSDDRRPTRLDLEKVGLSGLIADIVSGDDAIPPKPDPAGLLALCAAQGLEPERAVMIGDSPTDMEAALAAGTRRIGVRSTRGHAPRGAEAVVSALDEIGLVQ